jgi:ppGpp synthetase/RelA/SpoT-type nucleotidyltranferase
MSRFFGQELLVACTRRAEMARKAGEILHKEFDDLSGKLHVYNYKERPKEVRDIRRKVERKRHEYDAARTEDRHCLKADYNPNDVEDAWGCRFVTLLQQESLEVLEELLYLAHRRKHDLGLRITEIIVYSSRAENDPLAINVMAERVIEEFTQQHLDGDNQIKWRGPQNPESGYSSLHVIFALPVEIELGAGPEKVESSIEVQIRDVFEEGWGELSHRLGYKRYNQGLSDARELDRQLKTARFRELNALKASADAVSQHATLLDRSLSYFVDSAGFSGAEQSVSNIEEDLNSILQIISPESSNWRALVGDAYHMMRAAHEAAVREFDNAAPCEYYQSAASLFGKLIHLLPDIIKETRLAGNTRMPVNYHLQLELANALMKSVNPHVKVAAGTEGQKTLEAAIGLYRSLLATRGMEGEYARDATIHLRLGQALARAATNSGEQEQAIAMLRKAQELSQVDPQINRLNHDHWLPLQAIYEITKLQFYMAEQSSAKLTNIEASINDGDNAVAMAHEFVIRNNGHTNLAHKIINNTLYYRWLHAMLLRRKGLRIESDAREKMVQYFEALLRRPYKRLVETHTETIDTLMRVANFLDQQGIAHDMAEKNINKLQQVARVRLERQHLTVKSGHAKISQVLDEAQYELYKSAMAVSRPLDNTVESADGEDG